MMRRRQSEITDPQEIGRILSAATIGRLATLGADGYPYITPVNYVYTNDCIYFHCALKGEKLDNIAREDRVCFEVDIPLAYLDLGFNPEGGACSLHQFYHCVIIRGRARLVPGGELKTTALNALVAAHEPERAPASVHEDMPEYKACAVVEIRPESVSAKSDLAQKKSAQDREALALYLEKRGRPGDVETAAAMRDALQKRQ
jgi:nitroimidazol reductase NimA-like FMN-containing flavoprotein (pyridoxamine 5'-phosphate oxidase superfamily)